MGKGLERSQLIYARTLEIPVSNWVTLNFKVMVLK